MTDALLNPKYEIRGNSYFSLAGISHWESPLEIREKFNLSEELMTGIFECAKKNEIYSILPVSTCNRVELYANDTTPEKLAEILCEVTGMDPSVFYSSGYLISNESAVEHLYRVCAGLDSKVFGDSQITGQISDSLQRSSFYHAIGAPLSRLAEGAINTGKKIKSGNRFDLLSPSVAETAVNLILSMQGRMEASMLLENSIAFEKSNDHDRHPDTQIKASRENKYLIIGLGNMGEIILRNLLKHVSGKNITVINRTRDISTKIKTETGVNISDFSSIDQQVEKADIIFVATSSGETVIKADLIDKRVHQPKIFIDLGMPRNVDIALSKIDGIKIIDLDDIGSGDKYNQRNNIILAAELIKSGISDYLEWLGRYQFAQEFKVELAESIFFNNLDESSEIPGSKFIEGLTGRHISYMQKAR